MALHRVQTEQVLHHQLHILEEYAVLQLVREVLDHVIFSRLELYLLLTVEKEVEFLLLRQLFDVPQMLRYVVTEDGAHGHILRVEYSLLLVDEFYVGQEHFGALRILNREELPIIHHEVVDEDDVLETEAHAIERAIVLLLGRPRCEYLVDDG